MTGLDYSETYIERYIDDFRIGVDVLKGPVIVFRGEGTYCSADSHDEALRERFWELARKNGDTKYNGYILPHTTALSLSFTDIDITCKTDFDAAHPAGSSLKEFFNVSAQTHYPYIASGYKDFGGDDGRGIIEFKRLDLLEPDDYKLWQEGTIRMERVTPDKAGDYTFTITLTFEDGSVQSDDFVLTYGEKLDWL